MKTFRLLLMIALGAGLALAQTNSGLAAGTKVDARLQSRLNAQNAKVGDKVSAVTTSAVKEHGKVVLPKGTQLRGRVTSVVAAQNSHSPSRIGILFDQATTARGQTMPVHLAVASVTHMAAAGGAEPMAPMPEPMSMPEPMMMPMPMPRAAAGGGLNVGSALGAAGGLGTGVAATPMPMPAPRLAMPMPRVMATGGAGAGSVVSRPQGNLILNSGTRMRLVAKGGGGE
ncbi:MAG: hypothetical protein ACRD0Y_07310 [Terriglobales bacterium]